MNKMKTYLVIFKIILCLSAYGQVNWFPDGAQWHYQFGSMLGNGVTTLKVLSEDTLIGNNTFKKILSLTIRDLVQGATDTFSEILYVFEENQVVMGYDEYIGVTFLYDFNAAIGDTMGMHFGGLSPYPFIVDSLGTMEINGSQLAFQDIRFPRLYEGQWDKMRVVEGIGSLNSHLFHSHTILQPFDAFSYYFRCYQDENIGLINLSYNQEDCDYIEGVTSTLDVTKVVHRVFPNPAENFVSVQFDIHTVDHFLIVDIFGSVQIRKQAAASTTESFLLNDFANGVYFILGIDKLGRIIFTERFTKFGI